MTSASTQITQPSQNPTSKITIPPSLRPPVRQATLGERTLARVPTQTQTPQVSTEIKKQKSFVTSEIKRLQEAHVEATADMKVYSRRGQRGVVSDINVSRINIQWQITALKEAQKLLNQGYSIPINQIRSYSKGVGIARSQAVRSQYQAQTLLDIQKQRYEKGLKSIQEQQAQPSIAEGSVREPPKVDYKAENIKRNPQFASYYNRISKGANRAIYQTNVPEVREFGSVGISVPEISGGGYTPTTPYRKDFGYADPQYGTRYAEPSPISIFGEASLMAGAIPETGAILLKESERHIAESIGGRRISPTRRTAVLSTGEVFTSQPLFDVGETRIERWLESRPGGDLPYGLQEATEFIQDPYSKPEILSGERFSLFLPQFYAGAKLGQSKVFSFLPERLFGESPGVQRFIEKPEVLSFAGSLPLWTFFSPSMKTGATIKEQEAIAKQLSKGKFDKLSDFFNKVQKDLVGKKAGKEQIKYLNNLARNVNKADPKAVEGFKKLVQELYETGIFKGVPVQYVPTKAETEVLIEIIGRLPTMSGSGVIGATVSSFISRDTPLDVEGFREPLIQKDDVIGLMGETSFISSTNPLFDFKGMQKQAPKQEEKVSSISKLLTSQTQAPRLKQPQPQTQAQPQPQKQVPRQEGFQIFSTAQQQAPRMRTPQRSTPQNPIFNMRYPGEKIPTKPLFIKRKKRPEFTRQNRTQYDAYALKDATKKRKAQWVKLNTKPQSEASAKDMMARVVDNTISARGKIVAKKVSRVVQGKKKTTVKSFSQGKKLPEGTGYFGLTSHKYRPYKIQQKKKIPMKATYIEKQKYRLDRPNETQTIQKAKRKQSLNPIFSGINNQPKRKSKKPFRL